MVRKNNRDKRFLNNKNETSTIQSIIKKTKKELKKESFEEKLISVFLCVAILFSSFVFMFFISEIVLTGFASIETEAGTITELEVDTTSPTGFWGGVYGLVFRVPGFDSQISKTINHSKIGRKDVFFDCLEKNVTGGNEIFAAPTKEIDFDSLEPANITLLDEELGCERRADCPSKTFNGTTSVFIGDKEIQNVPKFETYRVYGSGNKTHFNLGALYDGENFVFFNHIEDIETLSNTSEYESGETINYQMMLPTSKYGGKKYYFFRDPYDTCPDEDIDVVFLGTVDGKVFDNENNETIENASVSLTGKTDLSNSTGYYNISSFIAPGTYNLVARKEGYEDYFSTVYLNRSKTYVEKNIHMNRSYDKDSIDGEVYGYIKDSSGKILPETKVYFGSDGTVSNEEGFYNISSKINEGEEPVIYIKEDYNIEYILLNFSSNKSSYYQNVTLSSIEEPPEYEERYPDPGEMEEITETAKDYWVSTKEINKKVMKDTFVEETVGLYNSKSEPINIDFELSENLTDFIELEEEQIEIQPKNFSELKITIYGSPDAGNYKGNLKISGEINETIPISVEIIDKKYSIERLVLDLSLPEEIVRPGEKLKYKVSMQNLIRDQSYNVYLTSRLKDFETDETIAEDTFQTPIDTSYSTIKEIEIPEEIDDGTYILEIRAKYLGMFTTNTNSFVVSRPVYMYSFFGVPVWFMFVMISFIGFIGAGFLMYKRHLDKKKRYSIQIDYNTLPDKNSERAIKLGKFAETKKPAYYEIDKLTVHSIVSGATGMGKSISAQVVIEECLKKNISVMVFDPTAQWSGMLRKCTDKKMLSLYPKFGLKPQDAQAFKGNVRMIKDHRQKLDINKYFAPGQIQIFSMNKLTPSEIDIFVANVIKQIFRSDPKESPNLNTLLVFDEVHRLLPKFGGSGKGFLQIERACREFRKWGLGVMLISQVMKDFVGEIKANINTEFQARTLDEGDLNRIKTKYGEEYLKSLVKAEVGVIMFQNADYNRGRPYFVHFRPILHSTKRLEDEELQKYNEYNDKVDNLEFQIEELEKEKVDTFDLKMELKLVKDKIMSGSFSVVDVYLEGLAPRVKKEWEKLGKKPPEKKIELVSEEEMKKEEEKTKQEKEKTEKEEKNSEKKEEGKKSSEKSSEEKGSDKEKEDKEKSDKKEKGESKDSEKEEN